jgi:hypothetical protein
VSTPRPTLGQRIPLPAEPRGAEAYFNPRARHRPSLTNRKPETVSGSSSPPDLTTLLAEASQRRGPKWEEQYQRASYYLPRDLLAELDTVATPELSKSAIVTAALRQYLAGRARS